MKYEYVPLVSGLLVRCEGSDFRWGNYGGRIVINVGVIVESMHVL